MNVLEALVQFTCSACKQNVYAGMPINKAEVLCPLCKTGHIVTLSITVEPVVVLEPMFTSEVVQ